jgi:hypothetical protein
VETRTPDLYSVKAPLSRTFHNLNSVGDCLSTWKHGKAGILTGEIAGEKNSCAYLVGYVTMPKSARLLAALPSARFGLRVTEVPYSYRPNCPTIDTVVAMKICLSRKGLDSPYTCQTCRTMGRRLGSPNENMIGRSDIFGGGLIRTHGANIETTSQDPTVRHRNHSLSAAGFGGLVF